MIDARLHPLTIPNCVRPSNALPLLKGSVNRERGIELRSRILEFLAADMRKKEIMERLGITKRSLSYHFHILYQISGAITAAGLMAWAFRNELAK